MEGDEAKIDKVVGQGRCWGHIIRMWVTWGSLDGLEQGGTWPDVGLVLCVVSACFLSSGEDEAGGKRGRKWGGPWTCQEGPGGRGERPQSPRPRRWSPADAGTSLRQDRAPLGWTGSPVPILLRWMLMFLYPEHASEKHILLSSRGGQVTGGGLSLAQESHTFWHLLALPLTTATPSLTHRSLAFTPGTLWNSCFESNLHLSKMPAKMVWEGLFSLPILRGEGSFQHLFKLSSGAAVLWHDSVPLPATPHPAPASATWAMGTIKVKTLDFPSPAPTGCREWSLGLSAPKWFGGVSVAVQGRESEAWSTKLQCCWLDTQPDTESGHCAFKKDKNTSWAGGARPNYPGAGKLLGPAFVRIRSWFWSAVLAAPALLPYFPAATRRSFGSGEHPSHPHTHELSVFPSPVLTAIIFKLLFRPFFFFLSSSGSSVVKIIFSASSLSYLSACAGGAAASKEEGWPLGVKVRSPSLLAEQVFRILCICVSVCLSVCSELELVTLKRGSRRPMPPSPTWYSSCTQ